jgi:oxalate decarboxylase/phosphoglucose isomerase-like protein (cupin superfamily)
VTEKSPQSAGKAQNLQAHVFDLPRINDPRGNLTFIEGGNHVPFDIKRIYYLYDVPGGASRAAHGHKKLQQVMIAMSGSFDVTLDDGYERRRFTLNRSYQGLYVPKMMWRDLDNFSSGAVCMVLASEVYDESDYYRHYPDFLEAVHRSGV